MNNEAISITDYITKPIHESRGIRQLIRKASLALSKDSQVTLDLAGYADIGEITKIILGSLIFEHGEIKVRKLVELCNGTKTENDFERAVKHKDKLWVDANIFSNGDIRELNVIYLLALRKSLREDDGRSKLLMDVRDEELVLLVRNMSLVDILALASSGVICYEPKFSYKSLAAIDEQFDSVDGLDSLLLLVGK